jgi:hypothetical protein
MSSVIWRNGVAIEVDTHGDAPPPSRKYPRGATWAQIPHDRGLKLAKQDGNPVLAVLLALEHAVHKAKCNRVKLTNYLLTQYGITHQGRTRGLLRLAKADVVTIEPQGRGSKAAPIVVHHWYDAAGKLK